MIKNTHGIDGVERIKREVDAADLTTQAGTTALENILMTRYPARDIATFAGLVNQYQSTPDAVRNFRTMFARVMKKYETYRVIAADIGICGSKRIGEHLFIDESETNPTLLDYAITAIIHKVESAKNVAAASTRDKTLAEFTADDWNAVNTDLDDVIKTTLCITNNNQRMRMICDETRTGITQFAACGFDKLPDGITGKAAAQLLLKIMQASGFKYDSGMNIDQMTWRDYCDVCITYMKAGREFQKFLEEQTKQFAVMQTNKAYLMNVGRAHMVREETDILSLQTLKRIEQKMDDAMSYARTAAEQSTTAAQYGKATAEMLVKRWSGFVKALQNAGLPVPTRDINATAQAAILNLYDQYTRGELDGTIRTICGIDSINHHSIKCFFDYCGTMAAYTPPGADVPLTLADICPGGEQTVRDLTHTRNVKKSAAAKSKSKNEIKTA